MPYMLILVSKASYSVIVDNKLHIHIIAPPAMMELSCLKSYYVIIDLFGVDSTQTSVRYICTVVG